MSTKSSLFGHFPHMEGAFFYCQNKSMDVLSLFEKVIEDEEVKDIPLMYIFRVVCCVVDAISTGECFYDTDFE